MTTARSLHVRPRPLHPVIPSSAAVTQSSGHLVVVSWMQKLTQTPDSVNPPFESEKQRACNNFSEWEVSLFAKWAGNTGSLTWLIVSVSKT